MYDAATGLMCFAEALAYLKRQEPVRRASWPKGYALSVRPDWGTLHLLTPNGDFIPWTPSSLDVLAEDWAPSLNASTPKESSK